MNAVPLAIGSLAAFFLAHRTYARWIERRVLDMDNDEPTPAHTQTDGVDYVPCHKHVLFGHHFCSVAGAAPIVGPAIAVVWGWLPALVWVVLGTVFIGAVHDFAALALSAKRGGRTLGDLAGEFLGARARVGFLAIIVLLTWVVLAVFAWLIAALFTKTPASVIPVNFEIAVALVIGWWMARKKGGLLVPSLIAVVLLYALVFWSARHPGYGELPASLHIGDSPMVTWIVLLLAYAYVASVLPVGVLLQPRDFINSHQLFLGLGALLIGLVWVHPEVTAPAVRSVSDAGLPDLVPLLFITIACGAISGFHGLVASGTTSKQLNCMRDARAVGYGGMLGEGTLAMIAVLATTAGLGDRDAWLAAYPDFAAANAGGLGHFVQGAGTFITPLVGGVPEFAQTIVAVIVISFAATTLDTATRIQRFCLSELGGAFGLGVFKNRYFAAAVAVIPAAVLAIFTDGGRGPGSGGFILWPVFGTTNQLIGALSLLVIVVYLRRARRPHWALTLPMVFLFVMTTWAAIQVLLQQIELGNGVVVVFQTLFLALEVLVLGAGLSRLFGRGGEAPGEVKGSAL